MVLHSGVKCDADRPDLAGVDQLGISSAQDVVRCHLPGVQPTPSILDACLYTVSLESAFEPTRNCQRSQNAAEYDGALIHLLVA